MSSDTLAAVFLVAATMAVAAQQKPDGREVATTDDRGRHIVSTLRWDGDALVASWRIQSANNQLTISFRYELQDSGRRLRATEQLRGAGRDQDNVWVFERP